jgi:hypothetical protein
VSVDEEEDRRGENPGFERPDSRSSRAISMFAQMHPRTAIPKPSAQALRDPWTADALPSVHRCPPTTHTPTFTLKCPSHGGQLTDPGPTDKTNKCRHSPNAIHTPPDDVDPRPLCAITP